MVSRAAHFAKKLKQFSPNAALVKINFLTISSRRYSDGEISIKGLALN